MIFVIVIRLHLIIWWLQTLQNNMTLQSRYDMCLATDKIGNDSLNNINPGWWSIVTKTRPVSRINQSLSFYLFATPNKPRSNSSHRIRWESVKSYWILDIKYRRKIVGCRKASKFKYFDRIMVIPILFDIGQLLVGIWCQGFDNLSIESKESDCQIARARGYEKFNIHKSHMFDLLVTESLSL